MANNVLDWAFAQNVPPSQKFVLVALSNFAHKDGSGARPGLDRLMSDTGYSRRSVQVALSKLEEGGLIQCLKYRHGGPGMATVWRCCIDKGAAPAGLKSAAAALLEPTKGAADDVNSAPHAVNGASPAPQPLEPTEPARACPSCGSEIRDERASRFSPRAPAWRCTNSSCTGHRGSEPWVSWDSEVPVSLNGGRAARKRDRVQFAIDECSACDSNGWVVDVIPAIRCDHDGVPAAEPVEERRAV